MNCLMVDMYLVVDMQEDTMGYCHLVVVEDKTKVVADMDTLSGVTREGGKSVLLLVWV